MRLSTSDVGQHQMWAAQFLQIRQAAPRINSGGLGTMGFGLPAAMGVQFANPGASGSLASLARPASRCASRSSRPASSTGFDQDRQLEQTSTWAWLRQWQQFFTANRYSESYMDALPDFVKLAESYATSASRWRSPVTSSRR